MRTNNPEEKLNIIIKEIDSEIERLQQLKRVYDLQGKDFLEFIEIAGMPHSWSPKCAAWRSLTRQQVLAGIQIFGGKWSKFIDDDGLNYSLQNCAFNIYLSTQEPPPSCRLEQVEKMEMVKTFELVCDTEQAGKEL